MNGLEKWLSIGYRNRTDKTVSIDLIKCLPLYNNWIGNAFVNTRCSVTPLAAMLAQPKNSENNFVNDSFKWDKHLLGGYSYNRRLQKYEVLVKKLAALRTVKVEIGQDKISLFHSLAYKHFNKERASSVLCQSHQKIFLRGTVW